jgi:hypothetical protein
MKTASFIAGGLAGAVLGHVVRRAVSRRGTSDAGEPRHVDSPTAVAAEALRTGVAPSSGASSLHAREHAQGIPGEDDLSFGDPDVDPLQAAYVGDEVPGGDMTTPDEGGVDAVGRAYGVAEEDSGALVSSEELLTRRDRKKKRG